MLQMGSLNMHSHTSYTAEYTQSVNSVYLKISIFIYLLFLFVLFVLFCWVLLLFLL